MRTEDEMLALILGFAEADDRIRAVLMNGSRVNPNVRKDMFQDYDIVYLVTDVESFKDASCIESFGDTIIRQEPEKMTWPLPDGGGQYGYLMQLADGNRIDLGIYHVDTLAERLRDSLTRVLLDKDNMVPKLPPPSEQSYLITEPTQQLFGDCCNEFLFGLGSHIPKTIWRNDLPLLKFYIEVVLRKPLVMMLGWEVGIRTGFEKSAGKEGRYLSKYLDPEVWRDFEQTYTDSDYDNLWESLFLFHRIFKKSAEFVAKKRGFRFPEKQAARVLAFLEHVKKLPADAETIY